MGRHLVGGVRLLTGTPVMRRAVALAAVSLTVWAMSPDRLMFARTEDRLTAGQSTADQAAGAPEPPADRQGFVGVWAYNAEHSINAATGRAERGAPGRGAPRPAIVRSAPDPQSGGDARGEPSPFAPSALSMRENRDMMRDLLEIAESLEFAITADTVTITDDLERVRTFTTDGSRQRTRLGASEFSARVRWDGNRLRRDIEGSFGFRMTETYFLSPDANRLFVILRVGNTPRGRRPVGADRVYDRVSPETE